MTDVESTAAITESGASCSHCGHELAASDQICPRCWRSVPPVEVAAPEPQPEPVAPIRPASGADAGLAHGEASYENPGYGATPSYESSAYGTSPSYGTGSAYGAASSYLGAASPGYQVVPRTESNALAVVVALAVGFVVFAVLIAVAIPLYINYTKQAERNVRVASPVNSAAGVTGSTASPKPSATSKPAPSTTTVPAGPGVVYRSSVGGFAARFPVQPSVQATSGSVNGVGIKVNSAFDVESSTVVISERLSDAVPADAQSDFVRGILNGFSGSAKLTELSESTATFRGRKADQVQYRTTDGEKVTALSFMASDARAFVLIAPTGSAFTTFSSSLVILP